jgi:hypothetical protein
VVVEVGCGLGDIISNIKSPIRYAIDPDKGAIRAARIVNPLSDIEWIVGDLSELDRVRDHIDVLLAIGWVHVVSPEYLKKLIAPHYPRIRYIVVDKFNEWDNPPFKHDFAFLEEIAKCIRVSTPKEDPIRQYLIYEVVS